MGEEFLAALLSLSLSGACLMGLAEVLARLLRGRIPPGVRRLMWLLVLFRLLCPWSISGGLLDRGTAELRQAAAPEHSTQALEEVPSHTAPSYEILEHEETGRQIDLAAHSYLIIGTLVSYEAMRDYYGAAALVPIYVEVEDGTRLERAIGRERKQAKPQYEEMCRRFLADAEDFSEEKLCRAGITKRFVNTDLEQCLKEIETFIR